MPGVTSPNPNDPRVIRTRRLILDAFVDQLNKKDFYTITINDITQKPPLTVPRSMHIFKINMHCLKPFCQTHFGVCYQED